MKPHVFLLIFGLCLLPGLSSAQGDAEAALPAAGGDIQQAFLNLPEERRNQFIQHLNEASRLFQQKRIFETLDEVQKAKRIFDRSPEILNLEGSVYVEMRNFDRAMEIYKEAEAVAPDNPSIKFNIAEVYFVTHQWQQSHDRFAELLPTIPEQNLALARLVEYKILLCMKRLGKDEEVAKLAEKYDFLDDSPFYYYANAAIAYEAEDLVKAEEWLAMAARIFQDPNILAPWQDTLVEFGYIKSFYGDDIPENQ